MISKSPIQFIPNKKIEQYKLLAECIRSDQLSASQVQKEFEDEAFKTWSKRKYII